MNEKLYFGILFFKEGKSIISDQYFNDGKTKIDFVLVWRVAPTVEQSARDCQRRKIFNSKLQDEGLILEEEEMEDGKMHFIKINAPWEVLTRYAEMLKFKMPMKEVNCCSISGFFVF